jgi:transcriptional regulator with XRE-family HTH domain
MRKQLVTPTPLPPPPERRRIRVDSGISGSNLAAQIGIAPSTLYGYETGREPKGLHREVYSKALRELQRMADTDA